MAVRQLTNQRSGRKGVKVPSPYVGAPAAQPNLQEFGAMFTREQADRVVTAWLDSHEVAAIDFESPLPLHDLQQVQKLVVVRVDEHDFGWVYFYDGSKHVESGEMSDAVFGNAPLVVDRTDGKLYITGTAFPIDHYLQEFRRGIRTIA